jgi:pyruvate dehydrogenase E1 component alpha subunit
VIGKEKTRFYREMLRIRRFEEKCAECYGEMKIRGFLHLYVGEEAIAVGTMSALKSEDAIVTAYREHGHALARGVPMPSILAEMFGKVEGCSRGHGGSMHLFHSESRFYGGSAIVGGGIPIAVGLALADRLQSKRRITACFFGEGAMAEGVFHESMNLAALWKLPVLFLCENNRYAMGTAVEHELSTTDLVARARSYGIPASSVDGMDVRAVAREAKMARDYVLSGEGPLFIEFTTYRFRAHSMYDPELYRSKDEVREWRKRDPLLLEEKRLREETRFTDADRSALEFEIDREIEAAVRFADAGTLEPVSALLRDVTRRERLNGKWQD